jgi:flavorubredoxin
MPACLVIDPADLRLGSRTPTSDHGCPPAAAENPKLRVITTFLGMGIMGLIDPLPIDRVYLVNPGEQITVGDRTLSAIRPPVFDNPSTTGFYDDKTGVLFSSDCFGALLQAVPQNAAELSDSDLRDGQVFWASVDSPWLHKVDKVALAGELDVIRKMAPKMVLSSHLPPCTGTHDGAIAGVACGRPVSAGPSSDRSGGARAHGLKR